VWVSLSPALSPPTARAVGLFSLTSSQPTKSLSCSTRHRRLRLFSAPPPDQRSAAASPPTVLSSVDITTSTVVGQREGPPGFIPFPFLRIICISLRQITNRSVTTPGWGTPLPLRPRPPNPLSDSVGRGPPPSTSPVSVGRGPPGCDNAVAQTLATAWQTLPQRCLAHRCGGEVELPRLPDAIQSSPWRVRCHEGLKRSKTVGKIPLPFSFSYLPCGTKTKTGYIGNENERDKYGNRKTIQSGRVNAEIEREPVCRSVKSHHEIIYS
jgi:hypothetical protein